MTTQDAKNGRIREFDFTLVLDGVSDITTEVEDALFEAGCDDATISQRFGRVSLNFCRDAESVDDAILSAIGDVMASGIQATVIRIDECHLVTQAEIANKIGRSRQLIHQYINGQRGPGNFPGPECHLSDDSPLWSWCEVANWLWEHGIVSEDVFRDAEKIELINAVLEAERQRRLNPLLATKVLQIVTEPSESA